MPVNLDTSTLLLIVLTLFGVGALAVAATVFWLRRRGAVDHDQDRRLDAEYHTALGREQALAARLQELRAELAAGQAKLDQAQAGRHEAERKLAEGEARHAAERRHFETQQAALVNAEQRLSETFRHIANEIFADKSKQFSSLGRETLGALLAPVEQQLKEFGKLVETRHHEDKTRHALLEKELAGLKALNENLGAEARQLAEALRGDVKVMGNWGEMKLERLLNLAGLEKGREYDLQVELKSEDGDRLRPDAVVWLPDGKCIVIDAKVSLEHYRRLRAAAHDEEREAALKAHLNSLRQHVRTLGGKEYQNLQALNSPNFVLMFVPSEPAYLEALQADESLLEMAHQQNVVLLSPTNLLATLRTVASIWHAFRQNENALEIARRGGLLYDKFVGFVDNLKEIGGRLDQARDAYDQAFAQLSTGRGNLIRQSEQLRELGARAAKQLDTRLIEQSGEDEAENDGAPTSPTA